MAASAHSQSSSSPATRRRIAILGSTGSIGRQTLDVVRTFPQRFQVVALAARSNAALLAQQAREFAPELVALSEDSHQARAQLEAALPVGVRAVYGVEGLSEAATHPAVETVVAATSGMIGFEPTLAAIRAGKTIALANKETLVMGGHIVTAEALRAGVDILPVDSEHSAIWQCLRGERISDVRRLLITASGGPFRRKSLDEMRDVTVEQALNHPTWRMGPKVTLDSATLMNKGLEVIEAHWLFDLPFERIAVVVHPQSIIHSMVEFVDNSVKMQAGLPSMTLPIQDALSYPERLDRSGTALDAPTSWPSVARLDFEEVDLTRFPCLRLAYEAGRVGGTAPAVLVGADEQATALFLRGTIRLTRIAELIEGVLARHTAIAEPTLDEVLAASQWAQDEVLALAGRTAPSPASSPAGAT